MGTLLTTHRVLRRFLWMLALSIAVAVSFLLDSAVAGLFATPIESGQFKTLLQSMRCWGEGPTIALTLVALALAQRTRWREYVSLMLAVLLVALSVAAVKPMFGRLRPEEVANRELAGSWHLGGGSNSSFPSGHVATAFAFASGLSQLHPAIRPVCMIAAAGTAVSRAHDQRHFLSDCVVAAIFGWTAAPWFLRILLRRRRLRQQPPLVLQDEWLDAPAQENPEFLVKSPHHVGEHEEEFAFAGKSDGEESEPNRESDFASGGLRR